ncbi:MAG: DUF4180 domain-containing protein [Labedaea sp.]
MTEPSEAREFDSGSGPGGTMEVIAGIPVLVCAADGPVIRDEADALGLIFGAGEAHWLAVPAGRLPAEFFRLRTGLAGAILQKFVNYRVGLVVLGDLAAYTEASSALRDLVRESNRGSAAWFLPDLEALRERLARRGRSSVPAG